MADDFFAQIQETEQKAKSMIEDAKNKSTTMISSYEKDLESGRKKELDKARTQYQEKLAQKNIEGREVFEQREQESKKAAQNLKKDAEAKLDKMLPALDAFFVSELLN